MKYKRLRIKNYRGVPSSEIKFETLGVTLVQGPNEVGKTSLGEAIQILFENPDNASNKQVKAIRPVHLDESPEIELEAQTGPYHFIYFKRFYKKPATKLTLLSPSPENLTGRDAHDRALEIIGETLDIDLWKALAIQQGEGLGQPDLRNQQSLSAALDKAAGSIPTEQLEEDVFEMVTAEYERFYSLKTGKEGKLIRELRDEVAKSEAEVEVFEEKIKSLDNEINIATRLKAELPELLKREERLKQNINDYSSEIREIESLENSLNESQLKLESAEKSVELANQKQQDRLEAIAEANKAGCRLTELKASNADVFSNSQNAEKQFTAAETKSSLAEIKKRESDSFAELRRADVDHYKDQLFRDQLLERKTRIDTVRKAAATAMTLLQTTKIDDDFLDKIDLAERKLLTTKAKLETAAPQVNITGLSSTEIEVDDQPSRLHKNESKKLTLANRLRILVPHQVEIEISAGASTDELVKNVEKAQQELSNLCRLAGAEDVQSARHAFDQRNNAKCDIQEKKRVESENLRDLSYDQLVEKLLGLEQSVPNYMSNRTEDPEIAVDLESAQTALVKAEQIRKEANNFWENTIKEVEAARRVRDEFGESHQNLRIEISTLENQLKQIESRLEKARAQKTDDALQQELLDAQTLVENAKKEVRKAKDNLALRNPEKTKALAETAANSLQTTKSRRQTVETEFTEVNTRLKIHGEEGLHEKLDGALTRLELVNAQKESLLRNASAVKLLFLTMNQERDLARKAYVAPLKERVEKLGRLVYDNSFHVEIDENLNIISRTSNNITVPFDSLSGGTKEQLSLIFRLACSMIVAEQGGMPLILDDTLGYTDPQRLQLMGAVLAQAAKECQIVILTCVPERYGNIGQAKIVSL